MTVRAVILFSLSPIRFMQQSVNFVRAFQGGAEGIPAPPPRSAPMQPLEHQRPGVIPASLWAMAAPASIDPRVYGNVDNVRGLTGLWDPMATVLFGHRGRP